MRDINRMDMFLQQIKEEWSKVPDWRFGQLMFNMFKEMGDPFYWEEEKFIEKLKGFLKDR